MRRVPTSISLTHPSWWGWCEEEIWERESRRCVSLIKAALVSLLNQSVPVLKAFQLSSINKGIQKKNWSLGKLYKQMCLHSNMDQSQQQIRKLKKVKLSRLSDSIVRFSILWYIPVDDHLSYLATSKKELWLSQVQEGWLMGLLDTEDLWISRELHEEIECWHHVGWAGSSPRHYNQVQAWTFWISFYQMYRNCFGFHFFSMKLQIAYTPFWRLSLFCSTQFSVVSVQSDDTSFI